jgi:hypothetical protein
LRRFLIENELRSSLYQEINPCPQNQRVPIGLPFYPLD